METLFLKGSIILVAGFGLLIMYADVFGNIIKSARKKSLKR